MSETEKPAPCYREANGIYFTRNTHRADCNEADCRGCRPCAGEHCSAKRSCTWHLSTGQLTCGRCIAAARTDLTWIETLAALMLAEALNVGVNSEAAMLAGPSVDPEAWSWRKATARRGGTWHASLIEEDDEHHPARVLGTWARMLTEDYEQEMPHSASLTWCRSYLDRTLHRVGHDDGQDFALLARELRKCRQHLEAVLHNDQRPDRGEACPTCTSDAAELPEREKGADGKPRPMPRLRREYAHYCADEDCTRINHETATSDVWRCPKNPAHSWSHADYENRIEERHTKTA